MVGVIGNICQSPRVAVVVGGFSDRLNRDLELRNNQMKSIKEEQKVSSNVSIDDNDQNLP